MANLSLFSDKLYIIYNQAKPKLISSNCTASASSQRLNIIKHKQEEIMTYNSSLLFLWNMKIHCSVMWAADQGWYVTLNKLLSHKPLLLFLLSSILAVLASHKELAGEGQT